MLTIKSAQKFTLIFSATLAFLLLSSFVFTSDALAQRTCCVTGTTGCKACDNSGRYWKNRNGSNVTCVAGTGNDWGCQAANTDSDAGYSAGDWVCGSGAPVGNACGGEPTAPFGCTVTRQIVRDNSGKINYGPYGFGSILYACAAASNVDGLITQINAASLNTSVLSYKGQTKAADGSYLAKDTLYCPGPRGEIVGAGQATIRITVSGKRCPACATEVMCTGTTGAVTGTAALACIDGAGCKPATGTAPVYKGAMSCSMPTIAKPADHATDTLKYYLKCDVYNGTKLVKTNAVNTSSATPNFANFTLSYHGTYKCSFRHCFENSAQRYCSAWGTGN